MKGEMRSTRVSYLTKNTPIMELDNGPRKVSMKSGEEGILLLNLSSVDEEGIRYLIKAYKRVQ